MHRVELHYTLSRDAGTALIRNPLPELLHVAERIHLGRAARALDLSYRHVWGDLKRWEDQLGGELIIWGKGQSAQLSEFGSKLLWAERQAQARLAPQIAALHADLERAFAVAFDPNAHVLTLYASHDDALAALRAHAATQTDVGALHLDIRFTGSVDAIRALNEGRCTLAGFHTVADAAAQSLTARTYQPLLQPGLHKIIGFAQRTQGLMVAPGNPLRLHSLADVARTGARFINRPLGSGTRVLLDDLLAQAGDGPGEHRGLRPQRAPHRHCPGGGCRGGRCGHGHRAGRPCAGGWTCPLVHERYHLACLKDSLDQPATLALRNLLQTPEWLGAHGHVAGLQRLALRRGAGHEHRAAVVALGAEKAHLST